MPIQSTKPISLPAQTYSNIALKNVNIVWQNLNADANATYTIKLYSTDSTGVNTEAQMNPIFGNIDHLFATAATRATAGKPALANAITAVLTALQEIEKEKGTI